MTAATRVRLLGTAAALFVLLDLVWLTFVASDLYDGCSATCWPPIDMAWGALMAGTVSTGTVAAHRALTRRR